MLTQAERDMVFRQAYIPEHLVDYVQAVSEAEPYIHEGYLCFLRGDLLILVGYPLPSDFHGNEERNIYAVMESARDRFDPATIDVMAPGIQPTEGSDEYFVLDLPLSGPKPEEAYMLRRAGRELTVGEAAFSKEHETLIEAFITEREPGESHQQIFRSIPRYLAASKSTRLLETRKGAELISFTIVDLGSADYGFYLFNFRSRRAHVPGATDLLFYEMAKLAVKAGKRRLNLGLGVNDGVRRFKEKWGAKPFLRCDWTVIQGKRPWL
jgi:hypothetical protein